MLDPGVGIPPYLDKFELVAQSPVSRAGRLHVRLLGVAAQDRRRRPTAAAGDGAPQSLFVQRTGDGN